VSGSRAERPHGLGEIVGGLAGDVQDLVRGEIKLARAELDQKLHHAMIAGIWLIGGALVGFAGLVVVLEGIAAAIALALPAWAALLIVGVIIIAVGAGVARSGLGMLSLQALTPDRTAANLEKDARMVKEHT
jgi:hypothetical protein